MLANMVLALALSLFAIHCTSDLLSLESKTLKMAEPCLADSEVVELLRGIIEKLTGDEREIAQLEEDGADGHCFPTFDGWSNPSSAREFLRRAEALLGVLKLHPTFLEDRISECRARLPKLTIECLPDEILSIIFDLAIIYRSDIYKTSLACSRFRSVILNTPSIWEDQCLDASMPVHFIEIVAQRSGTHGLLVNISSGLSSKRKFSLAAMFALSYRWVDVGVHIDMETAKLVQTCFPSPNLGFVHTFEISCNRDTCLFYRDWSMPNLRRLIILKSVPDLSSRLWSDASMLSECHMSLDQYPEVTDIVSFLMATPNLTRLRLTLRNLEISAQQAANHSASLHKLECLRCTWSDSMSGSITRLLASISSPHLEEIFLEPLHHTERGREKALMDYRGVAQHMRERYPSLKSFELVLGNIRYKEARDEAKNLENLFFLEDILWPLPSTITKITLNLMQVDLKPSRVHVYRDRHIILYPNLRELNIEECSYIRDDSFYKCLSVYFQKSGVKLDTFLPSSYPGNDYIDEDEADELMEDARAAMRKSGCWKG